MPDLVFSVAATDKAAQYDMQAKRLLGHKSILSQILGSHVWKGKLDLFNIVMIGLPKKLPAKEKLKIISDEYGIPTQMDAGKETDDMCNLGQGVLELGFEKGLEQGIERGLEKGLEQGRKEIILKMYNAGMSPEQIAAIVQMSAEEIQGLLQEKADDIADR